MKKNIKSKKFLIGVAIAILVLALIFFIVFFSKNNNEKLKSSVLHATNYSDGFTDEGFYACVVNSYNKENNTHYLTNEKLTDEQLASIKTVECNTSGDKYKFDGEKFSYGHPNYNEDLIQLYKDNLTLKYTDEYYSDYVFENFDVKNTNGIEKLTGLKKFVAVILDGESIDLSKNTNLEYLDLYLPKTISSLDLSKNTNLVNLLVNINTTTFSYPGLDKLINLEELYLKNTNVSGSEYDFSVLSNLKNIEKLSLINVGLNSLEHIKDLPNIRELAIEDYVYNPIVNYTLGDLKSIQNITYLYFNFNSAFIGELPNLPNLESLDSPSLLSFDLSKLSNLKKVKLHNLTEYLSGMAEPSYIKYLSKVTELKELRNLEYLIIGNGKKSQSWYYNPWENIDALDWFPNLQTLVLNNGYLYTTVSASDTLKSIYVLSGRIQSQGALSSLENVYGYSPKILNMHQMKELYVNSANYSSEYCNYYNNVSSYSKLEEFYPYDGCTINASKLLTAKNLKKVYLGDMNWDVDEFDVRNFPNLNTMVYHYSSLDGFENVTNVFNSESLEHYVGYVESKKNTNKSNLKYLDVYGDVNEINFDLLPDLIYLNINDEITKYKFDLSNNKELLYLELDFYNDSQTLLIQNCNKLNALRVWDTLIPRNQYLFVNKKATIKNNISFPKQFRLEIASTNNLIDFENNYVIGKEIGEETLKFKINNYNPASYKYKYDDYSGSYQDIPNYNNRSIEINYVVSDIISEKLNINKEDGYIYIKNITSEDEVINNIYYLPFDAIGIMHNIIDRNSLKSFLLTESADDFKIIKITSNRYKIEGNDITYYGNFDINNVRVTNAEKEVSENKLLIKYNNKIVDQFNLIKLNSLIGDTNDDGEITISDIILQYKHTEYELDLTEDVFYRADMDTNEDVELKDVKSLYNIIKNN